MGEPKFQSYLIVDVPSESVDLFKRFLETPLVRMAIRGVLYDVLQQHLVPGNSLNRGDQESVQPQLHLWPRLLQLS